MEQIMQNPKHHSSIKRIANLDQLRFSLGIKESLVFENE
jgi:hypothetical protein